MKAFCFEQAINDGGKGYAAKKLLVMIAIMLFCRGKFCSRNYKFSVYHMFDLSLDWTDCNCNVCLKKNDTQNKFLKLVISCDAGDV